MIDDLSTRLTAGLEALEAREAATRPDDLVMADLVRGVRRRRVLRTVGQGTAVAAVSALVVTVAWAGWSGLRPDPVEPAVTPGPVPSETVLPTPDPTTPEPTAPEPVEPTRTVVDVAHMPTLFELNEEVLTGVGSGWAAASYTDLGGDPFDEDGKSTGSAIVLVSPGGVLFLAAHDTEGRALDPVRWDGTATLVVASPGDPEGPRQVLSLVTGTFTPDGRGLPAEAFYLGTRADGAEVWQALPTSALWVVPADGAAEELRAAGPGSGRFVVAPDGSGAVIRSTEGLLLVDLATGAETPLAMPDPLCEIAGWSDPGSILVVCTDGAGSRLVRVDVTGEATVVREYAATDDIPWVVLPVGDQVLVSLTSPGTADPWCTTAVARLAPDGSTSELTVAGRTLPNLNLRGGSAGSATAVLSESWCGGDGGGPVHLVDLGSGATRVLPEGPDPRPLLSPVAVAILP